MNRKIVIKVLGILSFSNNITPELIHKTIKSIKVYGKIIAKDEIKKALSNYMD